MCVYLFVNITRFDLYSVILFCFYGRNRGKPTGKIHFSRLRVRSASLADLRMRICYQNNGGSNITRNMGQDGDGHAHFDQIWRPNITINYMGVDQNIKF